MFSIHTFITNFADAQIRRTNADFPRATGMNRPAPLSLVRPWSPHVVKPVALGPHLFVHLTFQQQPLLQLFWEIVVLWYDIIVGLWKSIERFTVDTKT